MAIVLILEIFKNPFSTQMVPIWKNPVPVYYQGMYMKKGSQFTPFIAHGLKKLSEVGIKNVLAKRHIIPDQNCKPLQIKGQSLGMEKFASCFAFYSVGIVISLIVLISETIFKPSTSLSQSIQKGKKVVSMEMFQIELQNLVANNGMKLSGDVKSGWIIEK